MKYYLYTDSIDYGDEFDVYFGGIINEETYLKYQYAKKQLKEYIDSFYFGTNEGWDDFDYLQAEFAEITENEFQILTKFGLPNSEDYVSKFFDNLQWSSYKKIKEVFIKEDYPDLYRYVNGEFADFPIINNCSLETFKKIINWYKNERKS